MENGAKISQALNGIAAWVVLRLGLSTRLKSDARHELRRVLFEIYRRAQHAFLDEGAISYIVELIARHVTDRVYWEVVRELAQTEDGELRARRKLALYVILYILLRSVKECADDHDDWLSMEELTWAELMRMDVLAEDGHLNPFAPEKLSADAQRIGGILKLDERWIKLEQPPSADSGEEEEEDERLNVASSIEFAFGLRSEEHEVDTPLLSAFHAANGLRILADEKDVATATAMLMEKYGFDISPEAFIAAYTLIYIVTRLRTGESDLLRAACDYFEDRAIEFLTLVC